MLSIRPVDPQIVLHKAGESQRINAATREQPNPGQHHFLQELQQQSARRQQIVSQTEDTEANRLQTDAEREKMQQQHQRRQNRHHKKKASQSEWDRDRGIHLDIKV